MSDATMYDLFWFLITFSCVCIGAWALVGLWYVCEKFALGLDEFVLTHREQKKFIAWDREHEEARAALERACKIDG